MEAHRKDPERVRIGRLGALTLHSQGKTNTRAARAAWEAKLAAEVDPDGTLTAAERARRVDYAMRVRMTRLAMARWGNRKAATPSEDRVAAVEASDAALNLAS